METLGQRRLVECVMNVSEGRDSTTLEAIAQAISTTRGVALLDVSSDFDHHRSVFSFIAEPPEKIVQASWRAIRQTCRRIDLTQHRGIHPRIGAVDVVPLVPLSGVADEEAVVWARKLAKKTAEELELPVFLYGLAARQERNRQLSQLRRGGLSGLALALDRREQVPDFGPRRLHRTRGACAIGVRQPLVAFNVYLNSTQLRIAKRIARGIRESNGGLVAVQARGLYVARRRQVQVSMNLLDYRRTSPENVFTTLCKLARQKGVDVSGSELIGLIPRDALPEGGAERLMIEDFAADRILENRIARLFPTGSC